MLRWFRLAAPIHLKLLIAFALVIGLACLAVAGPILALQGMLDRPVGRK